MNSASVQSSAPARTGVRFGVYLPTFAGRDLGFDHDRVRTDPARNARAGFPMLPVIEPDGRSTVRQSPASFVIPTSLSTAGPVMETSFAPQVVVGSWMLADGWPTP